MATDERQRPRPNVRARAPRFIGRKIPDRATYHDVTAQIAAAIQVGELRFGDRLPSERALSEQLDVSRATVRKACQVLEEAGVLEIRSALGPNSGMYVNSEVLPGGIAGTVEQLPLDEITGVLEARRLFEPRVAQLAGYLATKEDLAELERIIDAQRQVADDPLLVRGLDASFHLTIARATHNGTIVALMQTLQQRLQLARNPKAMPDEVPLTIEMHERTLTAIATHDPDLIELAMLEHLGILEQAWQHQAGGVLPRRAPDFLQASQA